MLKMDRPTLLEGKRRFIPMDNRNPLRKKNPFPIHVSGTYFVDFFLWGFICPLRTPLLSHVQLGVRSRTCRQNKLVQLNKRVYWKTMGLEFSVPFRPSQCTSLILSAKTDWTKQNQATLTRTCISGYPCWSVHADSHRLFVTVSTNILHWLWA